MFFGLGGWGAFTFILSLSNSELTRLKFNFGIIDLSKLGTFERCLKALCDADFPSCTEDLEPCLLEF